MFVFWPSSDLDLEPLYPGSPISSYICFGTFIKMVLIKNNNIYIFAYLLAILNLCKLDNHHIERSWSVNKQALEDI